MAAALRIRFHLLTAASLVFFTALARARVVAADFFTFSADGLRFVDDCLPIGKNIAYGVRDFVLQSVDFLPA